MIKVTARDNKFNELEFVFKDWVEAGGFMSNASRNSVAERIVFISEEILPDRELEKRPPEGFITIDDDLAEALKE